MSRWLSRSHFTLPLSLLLSLLIGWATPSSAQPATKPAGNAIAQSLQRLKQSKQRWIEIDLSRQRLIAWEGKTPVYAVIISTGKPETPTPTGTFAVQTQLRSTRMQGADYNVPDVPYTLFYSGNYAIHGAYWHHRFGTPVSHGCVNVAVNHARWLFHWATVGTPVVVHQ
jgi:lipoprotein-anchoring transpeptidase ErfK/SrfK